MARILYFYNKKGAETEFKWPHGEGVDFVMADGWRDVSEALAGDSESCDLMIVDSVPSEEKVDFVRRIKKIKEIPVVFLEEKATPAQEAKRTPKPSPGSSPGKAAAKPAKPAPAPAPSSKKPRPEPSRDAGIDELMESARRYIDDNFREPLTLDQIAAHADVSPSYFCRKFKSRFGSSPITYLRNLRISRASYLLRNTNLPLAEVAEQSGFFSVSYFCREFKKSTGHTPIKYRRSGNKK